MVRPMVITAAVARAAVVREEAIGEGMALQRGRHTRSHGAPHQRGRGSVEVEAVPGVVSRRSPYSGYLQGYWRRDPWDDLCLEAFHREPYVEATGRPGLRSGR